MSAASLRILVAAEGAQERLDLPPNYVLRQMGRGVREPAVDRQQRFVSILSRPWPFFAPQPTDGTADRPTAAEFKR